MKRFVLHPYLFCIYSMLFLYHRNMQEVPVNDIFVPFAAVILSCLVFFLILKITLKNSSKAGMITIVSLLFFFTYGHIYTPLELILYFSPFKSAMVLVTIGLFLFFLLISIIIGKTKKELGAVNSSLNWIALILAVFSLGQIAYSRVDALIDSRVIAENIEGAEAKIKTDKLLPDIYYIVLDGYTAESNLKKFFEFDNSEFINFLKGKGFFIADKSAANYNQTHLSLASSLNMQYLNYLSGKIGEDSKNIGVLYSLIADSRVLRLLKSKGYKIVHYGSGYGETRKNPNADINIETTKHKNQFLKVLIRTTLLRLLPAKQPHFKIDSVPIALRKMGENINFFSPKFSFAHIVSPHPPFLFERDGSLVKKPTGYLFYWDHPDRYINEIVFLNAKVKILIEDILSKSAVSPIIIIQGDHGTAFHSASDPSVHAQARGLILNSYFVPDACKGLLYDTISPVNSFRMVFNCLFGDDFETLKDRIFFSSAYTPYKFDEKTEILKKIQTKK